MPGPVDDKRNGSWVRLFEREAKLVLNVRLDNRIYHRRLCVYTYHRAFKNAALVQYTT